MNVKALVIILALFGAAAIATAGVLNTAAIEDEVKEARYNGLFSPQGFNYKIVTGVTESSLIKL